MRLRTLPFVAALLLATPAHADEDEWIVDPAVRPVMAGRDKVGCELTVTIAHGTDRAAPVSALAVGLALLEAGDDDYPVTLSVGQRTGAAPYRPPEAAYLVTKDGSNQAEGTVRRDGPPGRLTQSFAGERTRAAFVDFASLGSAKIAFRPPGGSTRIWTLDLSPRPDVRDAFAKCLAEINIDA